jgi:hypothetical protein
MQWEELTVERRRHHCRVPRQGGGELELPADVKKSVECPGTKGIHAKLEDTYAH